MNTDTILPNSVSITVRELDIQINVEIKGSRDDFCQDLKDHLQQMPRGQAQVEHFMKTNDIRKNQRKGLGYTFGFVGDTKK